MEPSRPNQWLPDLGASIESATRGSVEMGDQNGLDQLVGTLWQCHALKGAGVVQAGPAVGRGAVCGERPRISESTDVASERLRQDEYAQSTDRN
jgi:hypothetical protein